MKKIYSLLSAIAAVAVIFMFTVSAHAEQTAENVIDSSNTAVSVYFKEYQFSGGEICPALTVVHNGRKLVKDKDFVAEYKDNINVGTATATVTGIGDYSGTVIKNYPIVAVSASDEIKLTLQYTSVSYNGRERNPSVTVKYRRNTLVKGKDFNVSYSNNVNVGEGTVTIKGKGNYSFTLKKNYKIVPTSVGKLSYSPEVNAVTIKWPKAKNVSGYQVVVYDEAKKAYKSVKYVSANTTSYRVTGLNPSTLYTYNVRALKDYKNTTLYGIYTEPMQIRTRSASTTMTSAVMKGNQITAKWKTVRNAGYVLIYATDYRFGNAKEIYINDSHTGSYTIKNINPKAVYYVKVCPYTTHNGSK